MRARAIGAFAMLAVASVASAQLIPAPAREPGAVRAGCPADWEHREASASGFSCRDVDRGAFCSGTVRTTTSASLDEETARAVAAITARGFALVRREDAGALRVLVYDDAAGHRMADVVAAANGPRTVDVRCGAAPADFDALVPTFLEIARTAHP